MQLIKTTLAVCAAIALVGCAGMSSGGPQKDKTYQLTVLHTNDHHGRFWQNSDGEYGMAARKTLIDRIRAEVKASGGHLLLLDGGDVIAELPVHAAAAALDVRRDREVVEVSGEELVRASV